MNSNAGKTGLAAPSRYEGLDSLRALSSFGVVLFHVFVAAGQPGSIESLIKLRDFSLPLMVMASFFLITTSLTRKRDISFQCFFRERVRRLWMPLFIWSVIYCLLWTIVVPLILMGDIIREFPPLTLFLTGYIHLWFLQFIFIGSLLLYPLLFRLKEKENLSKTNLFYLSVFLSCLYGFAFHSFLKNYTEWGQFYPEGDVSLKTFVAQASAYIFYIPIAVGLGLVSDKIKSIYAKPLFRSLSLTAVLIFSLIHIGTTNMLFSRELYGIAVFLAALQPWQKIPFKFVSVLAAYSYGIYILHFFLAQLLWQLIAIRQLELDGLTVVIAGVIIYFLSFILAVSIRKSSYLEWTLPLTAVGREDRQQYQAKQEKYLSLEAV